MIMTTIIKCGYADRAEKALALIANGGSFNGTVYCKNVNKNNTDVSVYVDGVYISLGRIWPTDAGAFKAEFIAALSKQNAKTSGKDERYVFGTDAWLHSGMNAE